MAQRERVFRPGRGDRPNERWSLHVVSDRLSARSSFGILTVVDQVTRECVCLEADRLITGMKVARGWNGQNKRKANYKKASPSPMALSFAVERWKPVQWGHDVRCFKGLP
jgi:hypothetical protein